MPDGIKVDKNGNIFVTGPKGIWIWDAKGNHLGTIVMPEQPANLAWGDKDYHTLYITATTSVYRLKMKTSRLRTLPAVKLRERFLNLRVDEANPRLLTRDCRKISD